MTLEYARNGLIGLLTPQANTTVEPEFSILMPPGYAFLNARLVSRNASIEARLDDYFAGMADVIDEFANAPLGACAFACTGASYRQGIEREAEAVRRIEDRRGFPFITAGRAVADALRLIGAARVALISPYPDGLTQASTAYWRAHGFDVVAVTSAFNAGSDFHPIYSLNAAAAQTALGRAADAKVDAFLMLGTGMPTLGPILSQPADAPPTMSCMSALAWRSLAVFDAELRQPDAARNFLRGDGWRTRFAAATG